MSWVIVFCSCLGVFCLLVGGLAGMAWEGHCAEKDARGDQAEAAADEYIEQLRPLPPRPPRQRRTSTAAFLNPGPESIRPGQLAAEFDVEAEIARFHAEADEIIAWAQSASGVPYSADELWSGQ